MTADSVYKFGTGVNIAGATAFWLVLLVRAPKALSNRRHRMLLPVGLWLFGLGLAGAITIYFEPATATLRLTFGFADNCGLFLSTGGVFSSALVLDFVLTTMFKRRPVLVYGGTVIVCGALILLAATVDPKVGCRSGLPLPWYSPYWCLLCAAHLAAVIPCAVLCGRQAWRTQEDRPVRIWLWLLAIGFIYSILFWTMLLLFRPQPLIAMLPLHIGSGGWLITVGLAAPLVVAVSRKVRNMAALWALWPLWRDLVHEAPHVVLAKPHSRPVEVLCGVPSSSLRLYRRVIEVRDAILVLRDHADSRTEERARQHLRAHDLPADQVEPTVAACWLEFVRQQKIRGVVTSSPAPEFVAVGGQDLPSEVKFLRAIEEARRGPLVRTFLAEIGAQAGKPACAPMTGTAPRPWARTPE